MQNIKFRAIQKINYTPHDLPNYPTKAMSTKICSNELNKTIFIIFLLQKDDTQNEINLSIQKYCLTPSNHHYNQNTLQNQHGVQKDNKSFIQENFKINKINRGKIKLISVDYISSIESICIVISTGEIFTFDPEENKINKIGAFDETLLSASWNSQKSILALIDSFGKCYLTNDHFNVIFERQIDQVHLY